MYHPLPTDEALHEALFKRGIIAVLIIDDAADAVPLARALLSGGITSIELTLRTPAAMDALRAIRTSVPEILVGAGTVLSPAQVNEVKNAGAAFGVSPGMNPRVVAEARNSGLPFAPGVCTPTDIELAVEQGCRLMKFFPCETSGGLPYLRNIAAPFTHLGVKFIPLGGVTQDTAETFLRDPLVHSIGGSWLAPKELIQRKDWHAITTLAHEASSIVHRVRGGIL
ncbi:MAG: bifunctional 4-hydroxy-2-oxoglutarate aldolase/2-dehydro-3-deoxy-phosphogluconate aldolase [Verrucomicrobiota bacterium]